VKYAIEMGYTYRHRQQGILISLLLLYCSWWLAASTETEESALVEAVTKQRLVKK
jgi:hypothetical protein